ncbi:hypothetical protein Daesc_003523 [Daldinia eschscholtzii]|uniref:Cytochrome P450 n=1 Tax=Daldinia eschscholtzii TaxID=292717 RepID=A0AAX6MTA9_9PEZI
MAFLLIISGVFTATLIPIFIRRLLYPRPLPGIPYDKDAAQKIMGDYEIISALYNELTEWFYPFIRRRSFQLKSPIIQYFPNPFSKPQVMVYDPRETADLIIRRTKEFDRDVFDGVFQVLIPNSTIANSTTPEWKVQRKIWQEAMHPTFLNRVVAKNIYGTAKDLIKLWEMKCAGSGGNPIDIRNDFSFAALDALWIAAFGQRLDLINSEIERLETGKQVETRGLYVHSTVQYINELAQSRTGFWPAFSRWRVQRSSKYRNYIKIKDKELDRTLHDAVARFKEINNSSDNEEFDTCAMDLILRKSIHAAEKAGERNPDLTKDVKIRDEVLIFIYAGHDTTSLTLQWFVKIMTNNQEAQTKLREALQTAFPGGSLPSITEILTKDVPYLNAAIEESLRCGGTISRIMRVATMSTEIFGYEIPAGTRVASPATLSWLPEPIPEERRSLSSQAALEKSGGADWTQTSAAKDLDKYIPERWLKIDPDGKEIFDSNTLIHNAFGGGIRGCYGKRLAMLELRIMVVLTIMSFKFLPVPAEFNSFQVIEQLLRAPRQCYVKLEAV